MIELKALFFGFRTGLGKVLIPPPGVGTKADEYSFIFDSLPSIAQIKAIAETENFNMLILPELSPYSHLAAFLWYKELNVVSVNFDWKLVAGRFIYLDFERELVYIPESPAEDLKLEQRIAEESRPVANWSNVNTTYPDSPITILAEISTSDDLQKSVEQGADGIGVIKYEDIFLNNGNSEAAWLPDYANLPENLLIRFFDLGEEKFTNQKASRYLGARGVRIAESDNNVIPDFLSKLTSLQQHRITIILPMVTSVYEVLSFRGSIPKSLNYKLGITLETPAAALTIRDFYGIIDFIEIGLNDLTQYTMAWDRDIPDKIRLPAHEIVRPVAGLIKDVVGFCAEKEIPYTLGLDLRPSIKLARQLTELGVLSISCSPSLVKSWREAFSNLKYR